MTGEGPPKDLDRPRRAVGPFDDYARNAIRTSSGSSASTPTPSLRAARPSTSRARSSTGPHDLAAVASTPHGSPGTRRSAIATPRRRARADRDHRADDGLRHHRRRAGLRPGEVQEAVGGGYLQDRQQHGAAGPADLGCRWKRSSTSWNERETIEWGLRPAHVFDCAFKPVNGERSIQDMGHVRMMGAIQPFLGRDQQDREHQAATAEDIGKTSTSRAGAWAIAIYRDGSKWLQPLSLGKKKDDGVSEHADAAQAAAAPAATLTGEPKPPPNPA